MQYDYRKQEVGLRKEQTHDLGYSSPTAIKKVSLPADKWLGFKAKVYNAPGGTVKLESYIDYDGNGNWIKVTEAIDDGWPVRGINFAPYTKATKGCAIRCNSLDVADGGTAFASYQFKNWSIKEI